MNEEWDTLVDWLSPYFKTIPLQGWHYAFHLFNLVLGWSAVRTIGQHDVFRRRLLIWWMGNTRQTVCIQRRCIWADILWNACAYVFWVALWYHCCMSMSNIGILMPSVDEGDRVHVFSHHPMLYVYYVLRISYLLATVAWKLHYDVRYFKDTSYNPLIYIISAEIECIMLLAFEQTFHIYQGAWLSCLFLISTSFNESYDKYKAIPIPE